MVIGTHLILGFLTFLLYLLLGWTVGCVVAIFSCASSYVLHRVSSPPSNNPEAFLIWKQRVRTSLRPVLLCIGDSLTCGTLGADFSKEIAPMLCHVRRTIPTSKSSQPFQDPLWVVNAGQNMITSHCIDLKRIRHLMECYPRFVVLMVGTTDARAIYCRDWAKYYVTVNKLSQAPSMQQLEQNIRNILDFIRQNSPLVKVAVCTLPPLGEDLLSPANELIRQANEIIEKVVLESSHDKIYLIRIYERFKEVLEKSQGLERTINSSFRWGHSHMGIMLRYLTPFFNFDRLSLLSGYTLLWDGVHLNERAGKLVAQSIVHWLDETRPDPTISTSSNDMC